MPPIGLAARDVVSEQEIAERAKVDVWDVRLWRCRDGFPDPLTALSIGPVWFWPEIEDWIAVL